MKHNSFKVAVKAYVTALITFSVTPVNGQGIIQVGWKF
jgi:hypothetical protein